jgi:hypothetical protein
MLDIRRTILPPAMALLQFPALWAALIAPEQIESRDGSRNGGPRQDGPIRT